jgi:hypothetical protein
MNKMTAQEIINLFKGKNWEPSSLLDSDYFGDNCESDEEYAEYEKIKESLGKISYKEEIKSSDNYTIRVSFLDHDIHLQTHVYYSSYSGMCWEDVSWDNVYEVVPVEKTVTIYERKK